MSFLRTTSGGRHPQGWPVTTLDDDDEDDDGNDDYDEEVDDDDDSLSQYQPAVDDIPLKVGQSQHLMMTMMMKMMMTTILMRRRRIMMMKVWHYTNQLLMTSPRWDGQSLLFDDDHDEDDDGDDDGDGDEDDNDESLMTSLRWGGHKT